jgi:Thrombospondin type 3 repeat
MKVLRLCACFITVVFLAAFSAKAHAACTINDFGVLYLDSDCDGIIDVNADGIEIDDCPLAPNGDCAADRLDCDVDRDGTATAEELAAGYQIDWNKDGKGDACDDADTDGVLDYLDNCKSIWNPDQDPNACVDTDGDRFEDPIDNCAAVYNPNQIDTDADGVGDACDNCPLIQNPQQNADACPEGPQQQPPPSTSITPSPSPSSNTASGPSAGPSVMEGNGFGQGGCTLCMEARISTLPSVLLFAAAAAVIAFRRQRS